MNLSKIARGEFFSDHVSIVNGTWEPHQSFSMGIFDWRTHGSLYIPEEGYVHVKTYKYKYATDCVHCQFTLLDTLQMTKLSPTPCLVGFGIYCWITFILRIWRMLYCLVHYLFADNRPNFITLLGLFITTFTFLITLYHSPTLTSTLPAWVIILNGIMAFHGFLSQLFSLLGLSVFARQTLDATDGKQARRMQFDKE